MRLKPLLIIVISFFLVIFPSAGLSLDTACRGGAGASLPMGVNTGSLPEYYGIGSYDNNIVCDPSAIYSCPTGSTTKIYIYYNTEFNYDKIKVFSGAGDLLEEISGDGGVYLWKGPYSSNTLKFGFLSDGSVTRTGFDIYKIECIVPADTTPPVRSGGAPSGTVTGSSQTLSLTTNEAATCKYSTSAGTAYDSMANTFATTGSTSHSQSLTGLTDGAKAYYVRCKDSANNKNTDDYAISFTVDTTAPTTSIYAVGSGSYDYSSDGGWWDFTNDAQTYIFVSSNENAYCRWGTSDAAYSSMSSDCTTGAGTTTIGCSIGNVAQGNPYTRYVSCKDAAGNGQTASNNLGVTFGVDWTVPTRSGGAPSGTVTGSSQTLSLNTDEIATCKYSTAAGTAYDSMGSTFASTGGTSHSQALTGLTGGAKTYYVRCKDIADNKNTNDYTISFTVVLNEPPSSSISFDKTTPLMTQQITLSISASDDRGINTIKFFDVTSASAVLLAEMSCSGATSCTKTTVVTPTGAGVKKYSGFVYDSDGATAWSSPDPLVVEFVNACANWVCPSLAAGDTTASLPVISSAQYVNYADCTTTCTCPAGYNIEVTATGNTEANRDFFSLVGDCAGKYDSDSGTFNYLYNACGTRSAGLKFTSDYSVNGLNGYTGVSVTKLSCVIVDSTPPVRSDKAPSSSFEYTTSATTLSLTTNEAATCKYSTSAGTAYDSMANTFATTGSMSHSQSLGVLSTGSYNYYVKCKDIANNKNTDDYAISFSVYPVTGQPTLFSPSPSGSDITTVTPALSWVSAANANCYDLQIYDGTTKIYDGAENNPQEFVYGTSGVISYNVPSSLLSWQKTYKWKVWPSSTNCANYGSAGPDWTFNTKLPAPTINSPNDGASVPATPTLEWQRSGDANCYKIEIDRPGTSQYTATKSDSGATVSYAVPSGTLTQGQTYTWRIKPSNNNCAAYGTPSYDRTFTVGAACSDVNNPCDIPFTLVDASAGVYQAGICGVSGVSCVKSFVQNGGSKGYWKFTTPAQFSPSKPSYQTNVILYSGDGGNQFTDFREDVGTTSGGSDICYQKKPCTTFCIGDSYNCAAGLNPSTTYYVTINSVGDTGLAWSGIAASANSCGSPTPITDTVTVGSCNVQITHLGHDVSDDSGVRYKDLGLSGNTRTIVYADTPSGGCSENMKFSNEFATSANYISIKTTKIAKDASHRLQFGYTLYSDNCKFVPPFDHLATATNFESAPWQSVDMQSVGIGPTAYWDPSSSGGAIGSGSFDTYGYRIQECVSAYNTNAAGNNAFCASKDPTKPYCDTALNKCYGCSITNNDPVNINAKPNLNDCGVGSDGLTKGKCELAGDASLGGSCTYANNCLLNNECKTACCSKETSPGPGESTGKCITPSSPKNPWDYQPYLCR